MEGLKTTLSVIGSIIMVLFISFCIGMCSSTFRNKLNDVFDVVPEKEATQTIDTLNSEIEVYTAQINKLNNEKQTLVTQLAGLDRTNEEQATLIKQYETQINDLNIQIVELTKDLSEITKTIGNATINYKGSYEHIFFAQFDNANNYLYHGGYYETFDINSYSGVDLKSILNNEVANFCNNIAKSAQSSFETYVTIYDHYEIVIENHYCGMDINKQIHINFSDTVTCDYNIQFNGQITTMEDLLTNIDNNGNYEYQLKFDYSVNADNCIDSLTCKVIVNTL